MAVCSCSSSSSRATFSLDLMRRGCATVVAVAVVVAVAAVVQCVYVLWFGGGSDVIVVFVGVVSSVGFFCSFVIF